MRRVEIVLTKRQVHDKRIFISRSDMEAFPPVKRGFTIETDLPNAKAKEFRGARVMYPHDEYHVHMKQSGWFDDLGLKPGDRLVFETEPEAGEYRLVQVLRK